MEQTITSDSLLIEEFRIGHNKSFDTLIEKYGGDMYGLIMSKVKDPNIADDIYQEVLIKVMDKLMAGKFKGGNLQGWLTRLIQNHCIDYFRLIKRSVKIVFAEDDRDYGEHLVDSVEEVHIRKKMLVDMHGMIEHLPAEQQIVVKLRIKEDMPFKDIAAHMGVDMNNVQGKMRYAIVNLRKLLCDE